MPEVAKRVDLFRPDVVISANMPLDAQKILQKASQRHHARFVFWLQDVYFVAARFVLRKKSRLLALAGGSILSARKEADAAVGCDRLYRPRICRFHPDVGIPESKITVIRNWAPLDEVLPLRETIHGRVKWSR